jgi:DNA-binding XRE family transcriptional regulator
MMRALRNVSQAKLAEQVGVQRHMITYIEDGIVQPNADIVARLRQALDWPAEANAAFAMLAVEEPVE